MTILEQIQNSGTKSDTLNKISEGSSEIKSGDTNKHINNNNNLVNSGSTVMSDRYITPDYLAPLPPTSSEKTGKSPLQLLAQTCSQIGADTGSNKLLAEKSNGGHQNQNNDTNKSNKRSPALVVSDPKPVSFKPYEKQELKLQSSKPGSVVSLSPSGSRHSTSSTSPKINGNSNKTPSPATTKEPSSASTTEPVIRSGMEVLAGHPKDVPLGSFRLPSALDSNPAFRPPFGGGLPGYPPTSLAASLASSVCRDPYCRDPTCPTAIYNAQLTAALTGGLPPGYAELLQAQKLGLGMPGVPPVSTAASGSTSSAAAAAAGGPYICNWMNGREGYCGKRHTSAEELLQHLRTHTNLSTSDSAALLSPSLYPSSLLGGAAGAAASAASSTALAAAAAGLHRSYAGLGGLSSNRFHPYAKPGGIGSALPPSLGLGALGVPPAIPPSLAGLGAAAGAYPPTSLYALYGSRFANGSLP